MRGLVIVGGETAGYTLGATEPAVQDVLVQHLSRGDVFYDVGASVGFFSLLGAKLVGDSGRVYCFEPQSSAVARLRKNLDRNGFTNYEVIEAAVAEAAGTAQLTLASDDLFAEGRAKLTDSAADAALVVQVVALDQLNLPAPRLVKIDVEGAGFRVLSGMTGLLREQRPVVVVELHSPDERKPVMQLLEAHRYKLDVLRDGGMPHLLATPAPASSGELSSAT